MQPQQAALQLALSTAVSQMSQWVRRCQLQCQLKSHQVSLYISCMYISCMYISPTDKHLLRIIQPLFAFSAPMHWIEDMLGEAYATLLRHDATHPGHIANH